MENLLEFLGMLGVIAGVIGVPLLVIYLVPVLVKAVARRLEPPTVSDTEVAALRAEVEELRALATRVSEQEERLDFAERVLARPRDGERPRVED